MGKFRVFLCSLAAAWTPLCCLGFTLVSANPPRYTSNEVVVDFTSDGCANTGYSADDLFSFAGEALDNFWNKVSTSRLVLKKGSRMSFTTDGLSLNEVATLSTVNHILIGCNDDVSNFSSGGVLAVGGYQSDAAGNVRGAVLLNDHSTSGIKNLSHGELLAVMAHEIGHAFGLGHTTDENALMYYSIGGKVQDQMAQDDYDGMTYLYPNGKKLAGLGGSCGSVEWVDQRLGGEDRPRPLAFSAGWVLNLLLGLASGLAFFFLGQLLLQGFSSTKKNVTDGYVDTYIR